MSDEQQPTEPTPEEAAILAEAAKIVTSAADAMDMEGLYGIMVRLGLTIAIWRKAMRDAQHPMTDAWIDEAAMRVWGKFWHE